MASPVKHPSKLSRHSTQGPVFGAGRGIADGLLNYRFEPVCVVTDARLSNQQAVEESFFNSLRNLAKLYDWDYSTLIDGSSYPYNINRSFDLVDDKFRKENYKNRRRRWQYTGLMIVQSDGLLPVLATYRECVPAYDLIYIPTEPIWRLNQIRKNRHRSELLDSLLAYFIQVLEVPVYDRQVSSWIAQQYDYVREQYDDDYTDSEDLQATLNAELKLALDEGERIFNRVKKPDVLRKLLHRYRTFKAVTASDRHLKLIVKRVLRLSKQHPGRNLIDESQPFETLDPERPSDIENLDIDKYTGFVWATDDHAYDMIDQMLRSDREEGAETERAKAFQLFDKPQPFIRHDLRFANAAFRALVDTGHYLYDLLSYYRKIYAKPDHTL